MRCENSLQIQAYYDGELTSEQRRRVEDHLFACAQCQRELTEMRRLSGELAETTSPELSDRAVERLGRGIELAGRRGVLRIVEYMTAAAAAILVAGLVGLARTPMPVAGPAALEQAAVSPDSDSQATSPDGQLAAWVVGGSGESVGEP